VYPAASELGRRTRHFGRPVGGSESSGVTSGSCQPLIFPLFHLAGFKPREERCFAHVLRGDFSIPSLASTAVKSASLLILPLAIHRLSINTARAASRNARESILSPVFLPLAMVGYLFRFRVVEDVWMRNLPIQPHIPHPSREVKGPANPIDSNVPRFGELPCFIVQRLGTINQELTHGFVHFHLAPLPVFE